ncbi:unnamed protein product [Arctia plantaginis]|uniref:Uncharacterized protein n=1 Tax=Arctia plantaginis TaxID=874455 RepID=A0A8S0ZRA2_ARCPL|nr:unnamed protein product [Arctia plantaginis]
MIRSFATDETDELPLSGIVTHGNTRFRRLTEMADDERERSRILRLFEEASSGEESSKDPFSDQDGEYGSDPNYDFENDVCYCF